MSRMTRRAYFLFLFLGGVALVISFAILYDPDLGMALSEPEYAALIAFGVANTAMSIRRLHDMDATGWWAVFVFVPIVNMAFALFLMFWPGTFGVNNFGRDPRRRATHKGKSRRGAEALQLDDL